MSVSFDVSDEDAALISTIVDRTEAIVEAQDGVLDRLSTTMDLTACHANGCPLDLPKLVAADNFNLAHDVFGIARHLDRKTGKLRDYFVPRCSMPETAEAA